MVAIVSQDTAHAQLEYLEVLEIRASRHKRDAADSWIAFCEVALEIKDSALYKLTHNTWKEYAREVLKVDDSRIRQYKQVLPYAKNLLEVLPDITAHESELVRLKKVIEPDNPFMSSVYNLGARVSKALGRPVTVSDYRHCLTVLEDNADTNGMPSYGGDNMPFATIEILEGKVYQEMNEAKQRRIAQLTPREKVEATVQAVQDNRGHIVYGIVVGNYTLADIGKRVWIYE